VRQEVLRRRNRNAHHPVNAMLNYTYAVLEGRVRIAIAEAGLDQSIGYLHVCQAGRDSLVYDLMEPYRPLADRHVLEIIRSETFTARDFVVDSKGVCRLHPSLAGRLVSGRAHAITADRHDAAFLPLRAREPAVKSHHPRYSGWSASSGMSVCAAPLLAFFLDVISSPRRTVAGAEGLFQSYLIVGRETGTHHTGIHAAHRVQELRFIDIVGKQDPTGLTEPNRLTELCDEFSLEAGVAHPLVDHLEARGDDRTEPRQEEDQREEHAPEDAAESSGADEVGGVPNHRPAGLAEQHLGSIPELQDGRPLHVGQTVMEDLSLGFGVEAERNQLAHAFPPGVCLTWRAARCHPFCDAAAFRRPRLARMLPE
jgi:hypothetical protein